MKRSLFWSLLLVTFTILNIPLFAQTDQIDVKTATIVNAPDVRNWPVTTAITHVWFDGSVTRVDFTKKDGPNRWPDVTPTGWSGPLEYTLWLFVKNGESWVGSGFIQFWNGRDGSGSPADPDVPSKYDQHWYYAARWSPIYGHGPLQPGEQIGFMVSSGNARDNVGPMSVQERSNVVLFAASDRADYTFATAPPAPPAPTPVPTPTPVPPSDLSSLVEKVISIQNTQTDILDQVVGLVQQQIVLEKDTNTHVVNIDKTFAQTMGAVATFVGKYISPAVLAWIAAKKL
jgi:hypothetical protein